MGVGERRGVYICSPENGGNSFYIALLPTPRLISQISPSAYAFKAYPSAYFQGFQAAVTWGVIRFDLLPQKRGSKCVEIGMKKSGQEADTPALLLWLLLNCETVLSHKRAAGPLVAPAETVHPLRVCTVSVGQITALITPAAIRPLSVPFPSGGFASRSSTGEAGERIGKEWVID